MPGVVVGVGIHAPTCMKSDVLVDMKKGTLREMMPITSSKGAACIS
jgi:hypothetical protein